MKIEKRLLALTLSFLFSQSAWISADDKQPGGTTPPAAAAPATEQDVPQGSIEVLRMVLCKGVVDREPDQEITSAVVGDVVAGWTQIRSGLGEVTLTHRWLHEDQNMGDVPLVVRSSPWRTWSRKTISAPGNWKWQVLDPQGTVLKEVAFNATAAMAAPPASSPQ